MRRAITGAAILVGVFLIAPFVGAALLGFLLASPSARVPILDDSLASGLAGRGAAWLARQSGGLEVPSSNLGAPIS